MAKRPIFEETAAPGATRPASPRAVIESSGGARRAIRVWLGLLFLMVVAMIAVGGLTRLTDSGLSITEWRPVSGALPPLTETDWQAEFDRYQQIDQFHLLNATFRKIDRQSGHRSINGFAIMTGDVGDIFRRLQPAFNLERTHTGLNQLRYQIEGGQILRAEEILLISEISQHSVNNQFIRKSTGLSTLAAVRAATTQRFAGQALA